MNGLEHKLQLGYLIERNKSRVPGDDRSHASSSDDEFDGFLDARRQVYQDYDEEGFGPILGSSSKIGISVLLNLQSKFVHNSECIISLH